MKDSVIAGLLRWWLLCAVLLGALAGLVFSLVREPVYTADGYVVVIADNDMGQATNFAQAYARIAAAPGLLGSAESLRASASPDAPLVRLSASAPGQAAAAQRANQALDALIAYANQRTPDTKVRLAAFARAVPPATPSSPMPLLAAGIGAAGAVLAGGLAYLAPPVRLARTAPRERRREARAIGARA